MTNAEASALEQRIRRLGIHVQEGAFRQPVAKRAKPARRDRFLAREELAVIIELAKDCPADQVGEMLLKNGGSLTHPDPSLRGMRVDMFGIFG